MAREGCIPFVSCGDHYIDFLQYLAACAINIGNGQFALNMIATAEDSTADPVVNCTQVQGVDPAVNAVAVLRGCFTLDYLDRPALYVNMSSCTGGVQ